MMTGGGIIRENFMDEEVNGGAKQQVMVGKIAQSMFQRAIAGASCIFLAAQLSLAPAYADQITGPKFENKG